jgi:tetratricopeptide (TPR) repeat protein
LRAAGKPAEAIPELQRAAKSPQPAPALHQLALAYAVLGDPKAEETFDRVLALAPNDYAARLDFASYLWQTRNFDRGNKEVDRVLQTVPNDMVLRRKYAAQLVEQGRFEHAAAQYETVWKSGARDYDVAYHYGLALSESGRTDEGVARLRDAIAASPDRVAAHHTLGRVLYRAQRPEPAATELSRAAAIEPGSAVIQLDLGLACEAAGKLDRAEAAYREALKLDPKMAKANYTLGTLLARTGRREEGAKYAALYQEAFRAQQEATSQGASRKAELNLAWVALQNGETEKALAQFERHPESAEALKGAARALLRLGRNAEALRRYERAVSLAPDDLALRYELDREYDRLGRK